MPSPITSTNSLYEQLISQMMTIERRPQQKLKSQRSDQNIFKGVLKDFDKKLSGLDSALDTLTDTTSNPFDALTATVGEEITAFGVSAGNDAPTGTHTLKVDQLAKTDTRISKQYTKDETGTDSLRTFFDTNGAQTFKIKVASPTDADATNRDTIAVTVDPTGTTNEDILEEISSSINTAMAEAVDADTLESDEKAAASVISETSSSARLSLRSGKTGYSNRLQFVDSANGLLSELNFSEVYTVGTDETTSALNSKFTLDGVTLYRDSNTVEDALNDVTLDLKETSTQEETFTVTNDTSGVKKEIESFISKYNGVLKYIKDKSKVDPEKFTRGAFASETAFQQLRYNLRNEAISSVSGQPAGAPSTLADIGITTSEDGNLELSDASALEDAIADSPSAVKDLFASDDGVATNMMERLDVYLGADGILDQRKKSVDARIDRLDTRIEQFDDRLARREDQLRQQFTQLQKFQTKMQNQQSFLSSFLLSSGSGFS